ncbi:MAG: C10 family peptidase [Muribaculaceae bacterium]|nr:C10 family peptidase [Muribaculaceae bacterium]
MRKLLLLTLALTSMSVFARHISPEEALQAASQFMSAKAPLTRGAATPLSLTRADGNNDLQPYYVFNTENENGFIIISADDRFSKVLGYSDSGSFDLDKMPPQLKFLLDNFAKKANEGISLSNSTHPSWSAPAFYTRADEGVLLKTENWGQGAPYNGHCPAMSSGHAPTGCVATAMGIIMKYHKWPESYNGTTFNWDAMPTDVEVGAEIEANDDVATLMFYIGQAVEMQYGEQASGALRRNIAPALRNKFNFAPSCQYREPANYSMEEWMNIIKRDLDDGNPVLYSGTDEGNQSGHEFVIDGYNEQGFHINWGWDGRSNGYFALETLNPSGSDYSYNNAAVIKIVPNKTGMVYSPLYVDYGYNNNPLPGMPAGYNINMSVTEVKTNEPFSFLVSQIHVPKVYSGRLGIALVSEDGVIKEVIPNCKTVQNYGYAYTTDLEMHNIKFTESEIDPTDRIYLVSTLNSVDTQNYYLVPDSDEGYSSLPAKGNVPRFAKIKIKVGKNVRFYYNDASKDYWIGPGSYSNPFTEGEYEINDMLQGALISFGTIDTGIENIIPVLIKQKGLELGAIGENNDLYFMNGSDGHRGTIYGDNYELEVSYTELKDETITLSEPGSLSKVLPMDEALHLRKLTLTGTMDARDFWYIRDFCFFLKELDLSGIEKIDWVKATDSGNFDCIPNTLYLEDEIPDYALYFQRYLQTVILPKNIKRLGNKSLANLNLKQLTIPAGVKEYGDMAIYGNDNLSDVCVLNPIPVVIDSSVFAYSPKTGPSTLWVPAGCKDAYSQANLWSKFNFIKEGSPEPSQVVDVVIDKVSYHGEDGIAEVRGHYFPENVIIPNEIEVEGIKYSVTSIADRAFAEVKTLKSVVMGDKITSLGSNVFARCENLESVTLGRGISSLPDGTFSGCKNLKELMLPATIEEIAGDALASTDKLQRIEVEDGNPKFTSFEGSLYSKLEDGGLALTLMPVGKEGKAVLAPDCKLVKSGAIYSSTLNSIEFNEGVEIDTHGVTLRNSETVVTLPKEITLNPGAFDYCQINALVLKSTPKITSEAFTNSFIFNVIIDSDDENINLDGLFDEHITYTTPDIYTISTTKNFTLSAKHSVRVPFGAENNFSGYDEESLRPMWKMSVDKTNRLMKLTPLVYGYDFRITGVKINGKEVEEAFDAYMLPEGDDIELDIVFTVFGIENLTTHYDADFYASLPSEDLELNKTVTVEEIVYNCEEDGAVLSDYRGEESDIVIPEVIEAGGETYPVTRIASYAFRNYPIESVVIPDCITEIGDYAFSGTALKEISLPTGVKLGYGAFNNCGSLETVRLNGKTDAQAALFNGCAALRHLVIDSKEMVEIDPLFTEMPQTLSLYSPSLDANYRCSGDVTIYVPGAASEHHLATRASEVKEMWTFGVDRKNGKFEVVPELKDLTIDEVIVNGEPVVPEGNDYDLPEGDNVDIKVVYTLPNGHKLETHYTPEFISGLSDKVLQSALDGINGGSASVVEVYGVDGKFYMKGERKDVVRKLHPGIYIYRSGNKSEKIVVK